MQNDQSMTALVSMATNSPNRVFDWGKGFHYAFLTVFDQFLFRLQISLKFYQIQSSSIDLAALELRKKNPILTMGKTTSSHFLGCLLMIFIPNMHL